jgi:hypothetical protein
VRTLAASAMASFSSSVGGAGGTTLNPFLASFLASFLARSSSRFPCLPLPMASSRSDPASVCTILCMSTER